MKQLLPLLLFTFALSSCAKIDDLSGDNSVHSLAVSSHRPSSIVLGQPEIVGEVISIPILYGKYDFPMSLFAEAKTSSKYEKVIGLSSTKELVFADMSSAITFSVLAASGMPKEYQIVLREVESDENDYLFPNLIVQDNRFYNQLVFGEDNSADIVGVGFDYPLEISPTFTIADISSFGRYFDGNQWQTFTNGATSLVFENEKSTLKVEVIAQSGKKTAWTLSAKSIPLASPESTTTIVAEKFKANVIGEQAAAISRFTIDNTAAEIVLTLANRTRAADIAFPLRISVDCAPPQFSHILGTEGSVKEFVFDSWGDFTSFTVLDPLNRKATEWKILIKEFLNSQASVLDFTYDYTCGTANNQINIVMDPQKRVEIYPQERQITLFYATVNTPTSGISSSNPWYVLLENINITVSAGAGATLPEFKWSATSRTNVTAQLSTAKTFDVTAEDGSVEQWQVKLVSSAASQNSECQIDSMSIVQTTPSYIQFKEPAVSINNGANEIFIFPNNAYAFPMSFLPKYDLSEYARISGGVLPIQFNHADDVRSITVCAQDGTTRTYNVSVVIPAVAIGADITNITITTSIPGLTIGDANIDNQRAIVSIPIMSEDNITFPLRLSYSNLMLSPSASTSIPASGSIVFASATERQPIAVKAQNGSVKIWNIALGEIDYRLQLRGRDFNAWSGNPARTPLPADYWATANTSLAGIYGTERADGAPGSGYCAQMTSIKKNVILVGEKFAAGTIFLGKFNLNNIAAAMSDPVKCTYFGIPFTPTATIEAVEFDINYHSGGAGATQDWGSVEVQLIDWTNKSKPYEFHGRRPGTSIGVIGEWHPDNTAELVGGSNLMFTNIPGETTNRYGNPTYYVPDNTWQRVRIAVDGSAKFSHFNITFTSSAYGDYFIGTPNSIIKADNIRIIYK